MSGFEILTITFSFIMGLGVAQVLSSVASVVREKGQVQLHWIPFCMAAMILFFQVQFWFGLAVVNSMIVQWNWPMYGLMLILAITIFLSGATVLPPPSSLRDRSLMEDFKTRGRISLVFLGLYLLGWIGVGLMNWIPEFWHLVLVNGLMALACFAAYFASSTNAQTRWQLLLIVMTVYGSMTVWTTPSLEIPF